MPNEKSDLLAIIAKGTLGAIPIVGPLVAEIVGSLIPNQRLERVSNLLNKLEKKITSENKIQIENNFKKEESIDLLEEAMIQASRAISEERKDYIAELIINSLSEEKIRNIEYKRILQLLSEINDAELIYLKSETFLYWDTEQEEFQEKHKDVLETKGYWEASTNEETDQHTIFSSYAPHLVSLGLLKPKFKISRGEIPEFDENTGMVKYQGYEVTHLGNLLLKSIGLIEGEED